MLSMVELFSFVGFPARVAGRALLVSRYISNRGALVRVTSDYGERRFGKSVKYRPWIMIDVMDLELLDELINNGTDAQVEAWRVSQLSVCGMIAIIVSNHNLTDDGIEYRLTCRKGRIGSLRRRNRAPAARYRGLSFYRQRHFCYVVYPLTSFGIFLRPSAVVLWPSIRDQGC
jgi:hypothetical protein